MFGIPALISGKIASYVAVGLLAIILVMGVDIWWLGSRLDKAKANYQEAKAAYILVADKLVEQNAAVNEMGDRKKYAEARAAEAFKKANRLKEELAKAEAKINDHKYDPNKTPCVNAMDLIEGAKK